MKLEARRVLARMSGERWGFWFWCGACQRHFWVFSKYQYDYCKDLGEHFKCGRCSRSTGIVMTKEVLL